jgi:hypothetical protein
VENWARGGHVRGDSRLVLLKSRRCRGRRDGRISMGCAGCEEGGRGVKAQISFLVVTNAPKRSTARENKVVGTHASWDASGEAGSSTSTISGGDAFAG